MKKLVRVPAALARLSVGKTRFYELVNEGRLKLVNVSTHAVAAIEDPECSPGSLDALIEELSAKGHTPKQMPNAHGAKAKKAVVVR